MKYFLDLTGFGANSVNIVAGSSNGSGLATNGSDAAERRRPAPNASLAERLEFYFSNLKILLDRNSFIPHEAVEARNGAAIVLDQIEKLFQGYDGARKGKPYAGRVEKHWYDLLVQAGIGDRKVLWTKKFSHLATIVAEYGTNPAQTKPAVRRRQYPSAGTSQQQAYAT